MIYFHRFCLPMRYNTQSESGCALESYYFEDEEARFSERLPFNTKSLLRCEGLV